MRFYLLVFISFFLISACTEGGYYYTENPSANGVLLDGESNQNISGFAQSTGTLDPSTNATVSNKVFFTITGKFIEDSSGSNMDYAIQVINSNSISYYLFYKDSDGNLARDTVNYTDGKYIQTGDDDLFYMKNTNFEDITTRGIILIGTNMNYTLYFQLNEPQDLTTTQICYGYFDSGTKTISNANCFQSWQDLAKNKNTKSSK